jgi:CBS domain-containing protein
MDEGEEGLPSSPKKLTEFEILMDEKHFPRLVRDVMTVGVMTCAAETSVQELTRWVLEKDLEAVIVLDSRDGNALGVVSQVDLVRFIGKENAPTLTAEQVMSEGVPQVPPDIPLEAAAQIMLDKGIRALFLMHHAGGIEYPAAVLTFNHLLRCLAAEGPEELKDLGIKAVRQSPLESYLKRREAARERYTSHERPAGKSSLSISKRENQP